MAPKKHVSSGAEGRGRAALPAKVSVPRANHAVARARVFGLLDRAVARGAVWVAAPAGAGKTTAVASYLAARRRPAVWYDVDATDADVANVFLYLAQGVRAATRSRRRMPVFQVAHLGSLRAFARKFFEALYALLPKGATLVLDNCHTVADSPAWTAILEEAARSVPQGRALIVVSRTAPPAGFLRQLVNERLALVSGNELRFTDGEAKTLVRRRVPALGRGQRAQVARLCALADGWAAGLVLALDHLTRDQRPPELVQHDERLFDYFSAEILAELPPEAQRVLFATALLPCMTERMASAVSGSATAGALLGDLHRSGLLVERLTTQPATYRYHPLLKAFLLAREPPAPALLAQAAEACVEGGFLDEAVDLFTRAGAPAETARLVLTHAPRLVAEGRYGTLGAWLARLDAPVIAAEPWLCFWLATANMAADAAVSRLQFERAFEGFRARGDAAGLYLTVAGAAQVIFIEAEDFRRLDPWFERFDELSTLGPRPPSDDVEATALASLLVAVCYARPGYPGAPSWLARARALVPPDRGARARLWSALVLFASVTGQLEVIATLPATRPHIDAGLDPLTRIMVIEGEIHYSLTALNWRESLATFIEAVELARGEALRLFEATFLAGCAQPCAIGGDEAGAADYIRQAAAAEAETPSAHLMPAGLLDYARGVAAFARGAFEAATRSLEKGLASSVPIGLRWGEILTRTLYILALGALGRDQDAERELARMTGDAAPVSLTAVGLQLFSAERHLREGYPAAAADASRALGAARTYASYASLYLRALPRLLAFALRDPAHGPWLAERIVANRIRPWPQHLDLAAWPYAVRVRALGDFEVAGALVSRSRKTPKAPLRLLECLVAAGGRPLLTATACNELWPDDAAPVARRKLDITLHRLRKLIGEDTVGLTNGALALDRTRCFVDAWAFTSLAAQAERALGRDGAAGAAGEARTAFDEAVRLYRGPLLPAEEDLPAVGRARDGLRRRFVRLVQTYAGAVEARDITQAVALYEQALDLDELAEPLSQGLMRGYLALGRPADVAREYERCQLALHAARGAQPAAETRALYDESRRAMRSA